MIGAAEIELLGVGRKGAAHVRPVLQPFRRLLAERREAIDHLRLRGGDDLEGAAGQQDRGRFIGADGHSPAIRLGQRGPAGRREKAAADEHRPARTDRGAQVLARRLEHGDRDLVVHHQSLVGFGVRQHDTSAASLAHLGPAAGDEESALRQADDPQRTVKLVLSEEPERLVSLEHDLRLSVAAEPPLPVRKGCSLDAHQRVAAVDDVLLDEAKILVVLIDVVFVHALRQAAHDEELAVTNANPTCPVEYLLDLVLFQERQITGVVHVDPGISPASSIVELAQVDGDVDLSVVETDVAVVTGNRDLLQDFSLPVGLHQGCRERPVDRVPLVGADALQVMRVGAFARDRVEFCCYGVCSGDLRGKAHAGDGEAADGEAEPHGVSSATK